MSRAALPAGWTAAAIPSAMATSTKVASVPTGIEALLGRVVNGEGHYLPRVREVWIFGSYARGALEVGDVDLAVQFDQTKDEAGRWFAP